MALDDPCEKVIQFQRGSDSQFENRWSKTRLLVAPEWYNVVHTCLDGLHSLQCWFKVFSVRGRVKGPTGSTETHVAWLGVGHS